MPSLKEKGVTAGSSICGTVASSTSSKSEPQCRTLHSEDPCDAGSRRASGRRPSAGPSSSSKEKYCGPASGGGVFCPRGAWCVSCSTSSLALVVCRRSASFCSTLCELWWSCSARAIAIDNRSCRSHERSRRSRQRLADVASSRAT